MTIHENQLIHLDEGDIEEIVAQVLQSGEIQTVHDLIVLRDQHKGEFDTAQRLRAQENGLKVKLVELMDSRDATQKVHDTLGEKVRMTEEDGYKAIMNAKGIEEIRAAHGVRTGKVVRHYVGERLESIAEYMQWMVDLVELQCELDTFPGRIKELERRVFEAGEIANAQFKKAGEVLLAIRELETVLNA